MTQIEMHIETPLGSRYLKMPCGHFSRKVPATWDAARGEVDFKPGRCEMRAVEARLLIICIHTESQAVERMRHIVEDHLVRFSRKEGFTIAWQNSLSAV